MSEHGKCKQAIVEISETIPDRLRELDEQFMEVLDSRKDVIHPRYTLKP